MLFVRLFNLFNGSQRLFDFQQRLGHHLIHSFQDSWVQREGAEKRLEFVERSRGMIVDLLQLVDAVLQRVGLTLQQQAASRAWQSGRLNRWKLGRHDLHAAGPNGHARDGADQLEEDPRS